MAVRRAFLVCASVGIPNIKAAIATLKSLGLQLRALCMHSLGYADRADVNATLAIGTRAQLALLRLPHVGAETVRMMVVIALQTRSNILTTG